MEGPDKFRRLIVIEFPALEQGVARFTSPEYDKAAAFRRSSDRFVPRLPTGGPVGRHKH